MPVESTKAVGIRRIIGKNEVKEVLSVLEQDESTMDANWNRRFRNNIEKLRSGDIYQLAEVIRDLSIRKRAKVLSAGETRMVMKARRLLISKLTCASGGTDDKTEAMIDEALDESHHSRVLAGL